MMLNTRNIASEWISRYGSLKSISNQSNKSKNIMSNSFMKNKIFQNFLGKQPAGCVVKVVTDIDDTIWSSGGVR